MQTGSADERALLEAIIERFQHDDEGLEHLSGLEALAALMGRVSANAQMIAEAALMHLDREHGGEEDHGGS